MTDSPPSPPVAPANTERKVTSSDDPFEFIRGLARAAYEGDGRAQYLVAHEFGRCDQTLSLVRKEQDPEAAIWARSNWPQSMRERDIAEYRRCVRLVKEDPFGELPPRAGGYTQKYWIQRSAQAGYPLAVAEQSVATGLRAESLDGLTAAALSGEPDVALIVGNDGFQAEDPARSTSAAAWMLAACRMGADCGASSKIIPFWMCYDPEYPACAADGNVELMLSTALGPAQNADAYRQSQAIEDALRNHDEATVRALLAKLSN